MIKLTDIHWAAGFLEGEGSFTISTNQTYNEQSIVQATQVVLGPLQKLQRLFGGSIYVRTNRWQANRKQAYIWTVGGPNHSQTAISIMMTLYPLMSERRQEQIRNTLANWRTYKYRLSARQLAKKEVSLEN